MSESTDYRSISCDIHSQLELFIMYKKSLQIEYIDNTEKTNIRIKPLDIIARKGEGEFLLATDESNNRLEIRLDKLCSFKEL
jgi:transcriptional antiterminator Rof (Rho-off)